LNRLDLFDSLLIQFLKFQFKLSKKMKKSIFTIIANLVIVFYASAQLKVGNNPSTIGTNNNLEVESSSGKKVIINKTTGATAIDYTPSAFKTDSVLLKDPTSGEIRQMSFTRFKALYGGGSSTSNGACAGLGYTPSGTSSTAPNSFVVPNTTIVATKVNSVYSYNGHTYALYVLNGNVNWGTCQNAAKSIGGYLSVITNALEWNYINTNILSNPASNNCIWIGYRKYDTAGNNTSFNWITCEGMEYNYDTYSYYGGDFASGEPNNNGGAEGCVHIIDKSKSAGRQWNDSGCNMTSLANWCNWNTLLVEFDQ
jgi:hypothetical protein